MAVFVTGDLHGDKDELLRRTKVLDETDTLIVAGDFGFLWSWDSWGKNEEFLESLPFTIYVCLGNHENYDMLKHFPLVAFPVNDSFLTELTENCYVMDRGGIFTIEGKVIYSMGGAYSIDKKLRTEGISWWVEELPEEMEYIRSEKVLDRRERLVDYIITHSAPYEIATRLKAFGLLNLKKIYNERELPLMEYLDSIYQTVAFKKWYFGHFHINAEIEKDIECLYTDIKELK